MNDFSIGFALFRSPLSPSQSRTLFTKEIRQILHNQDQWWLCLGIFKENWSSIFSLMREARVLKLELGRNEHCRMVEEVRGVGFPLLQALCFGKNRIVSLEPLQHLHAPALQWLSFEENCLTDLRPLRKTAFKHLTVLNLKTNKIRELDLRAFQAPLLAKLTLEAYHTDRLQGESLAWAFAMQTKALQILRCRSEQRIVNNRHRLALRQKYPELNLKRFDPNNMEEEDESESDHE